MITKIFYSLVLFWNINYNEKNSLWFFLSKISEATFWKIELIFENSSWNTMKVWFTHKKLLWENFSGKITKNWGIISDDKKLENYIFEKINISDQQDFPFFESTQFYRDLAFWVVLTITSKCNIFCYYCFNDIDYEINQRNTRKNYWLDYWINIIDDLYNQGTRVVILTGWEPMVAPFFWKY